MNESIKELAKSLGISEKELLSFADLVVSELKRDDVKNLDKISPELQTGLVLAYTEVASLKFNRFSMAVKHNESIKAHFSEGVLSALRKGE